MTALWPAEMNSEVLLLIVSLQKLYFEPPSVIAVFCDRSRWRVPQPESVFPLPLCPFQQTFDLLPLIVSAGVTVARGAGRCRCSSPRHPGSPAAARSAPG